VFFRRRPKLPADRRPALAVDERVLAWATVAGDQVVVATNRGLWLPGRDLLGWHEIHKAAWSGRELRVTPAEPAGERDGYEVVADAPEVTLFLLDPGELPHQVRARVTRSVAYSVHHPLAQGGAGVRVVARRVAGVDGLSWAVRYDAGVPADAPAVVERTGELVAQAQAASTPAG
jgi:hypothetical protein